MTIHDLINGINIEEEIGKILRYFHTSGPINPASLEKLAYYKKFHNDIFLNYESSIIRVMGLFYKKSAPPLRLVDEVYNLFSDSIHDEFGVPFTPVQASAYKQIKSEKYFSFSAPTSAGKSFLFRELIKATTSDIIIVVPSRALIAEYYKEVIELVDKRTLVLQFIENINTDKVDKRIFIITPERGVELFKKIANFNIGLFLFDEAQISEEEIRGLKFDAFVRRVDRVLPTAKKVFAHPFVANPEAQLKKHDFRSSASAQNYKQQTVGKIFLSHYNNNFAFFSPHENNEVIESDEDIVERIIINNGTMLAYVSKSLIYSSNGLNDYFGKYINLCDAVSDNDAKKIIDKLSLFIGASKRDQYKFSLMISMMEKGIVIHHGSMPLRSRLLVEEFIRKGYAKICFATSTLNQGINMPFNVVWIHNFRNMDVLTLKNLIGRAGRTLSCSSEFDYGYSIIESPNVNTFKRRYLDEYELSAVSKLEDSSVLVDSDFNDVVDAVKNDTYNDEYNLPEAQIERIRTSDVASSVQLILDSLFDENGVILSGNEYYKLSKSNRDDIKKEFQKIFCGHLTRKELTTAEKKVLSAAIPILLWHVQSKSFSEIVSLRHSHISRRTERSQIRRDYRNNEITEAEMKIKLRQLTAQYSPIGTTTLPNKNLRGAPLFPQGTPVEEISYDVIVYDTYDYLDKVISISLADPICAAFDLYYTETSDKRALSMINFIKFGTDNPKFIWLLKYGFSAEDFIWLDEVVEDIDSRQIFFNSKVSDLDAEKQALIERYL